MEIVEVVAPFASRRSAWPALWWRPLLLLDPDADPMALRLSWVDSEFIVVECNDITLWSGKSSLQEVLAELSGFCPEIDVLLPEDRCSAIPPLE